MHARQTRSLAQKGFSLLPSSLSSSSRHLSSSSPVSAGKLAGKVAVVTASTEGIGLAIAQNLGRHGASVMLSSRKEDNVEKAVQQLKAEGLDVEGMVCHVGKSSDRAAILESTVKRWGGLDILVSNAAVNPYLGPAVNCPEKTWDKIFDINLKSSFLMFQACQPHFQVRGGGSAVFVASFLGFQQYPLLGPYSVSKTALIGLTKVLSAEMGSDNIRVNCIAPGWITTKFSEKLVARENGQKVIEEYGKKYLENTPLARFGRAEEMGGIVSFLSSDEATYITGETIVLSGGTPSRL